MDKLDAMQAVTRMQEYIETHISEPITLRQLAEVAGYSPWHAAKLFREVMGSAPFDYIRRRRLTQASAELRDGGANILDVALDFVFASHEGFTRAFSKEFGLTPSTYRRFAPPIPWFMPEKAVNSYLFMNQQEGEEHMQTTKAIFVQVIERPERKLLLKRGVKATHYCEYCEEVGCDVWGVLSSVKEALYEPAGFWLPKHLIPPGTSEYVQGIELPPDWNKAVPDGLEVISLPPCTVMVFQGEPYEDDEQFGEAGGEVWEHLKRFDPKLYGYQWALETAPRFQLAPMGYRGYIEARPVVKA